MRMGATMRPRRRADQAPLSNAGAFFPEPRARELQAYCLRKYLFSLGQQVRITAPCKRLFFRASWACCLEPGQNSNSD